MSVIDLRPLLLSILTAPYLAATLTLTVTLNPTRVVDTEH